MTEPSQPVIEQTLLNAIAALASSDPVVRVVITPGQYDDMVTRWAMEDQLPTSTKMVKCPDGRFWGVPMVVDPDADTGWVERRSGHRDPLPTL